MVCEKVSRLTLSRDQGPGSWKLKCGSGAVPSATTWSELSGGCCWLADWHCQEALRRWFFTGGQIRSYEVVPCVAEAASGWAKLGLPQRPAFCTSTDRTKPYGSAGETFLTPATYTFARIAVSTRSSSSRASAGLGLRVPSSALRRRNSIPAVWPSLSWSRCSGS